jgi:hypothetical protein
MKTYQITLVYTAYTHYVIEAESEEAAEAQAWQRVDADNGECTQYGEWETSEIAELNYANS